MDLKIKFLGAAKNVTGSCYLVEANGTKLIIDCGMYQERKFKSRNWDPFPTSPGSIDAVLLTHAHLDHCGRLPKLVKEGFSGKIHTGPATANIAKIVLLDSARIQVEDVKYKKKRHKREGRKGPHPLVPLYTVEDAEKCLPMFVSHEYDKTTDLGNGITVVFKDAGHILGSSMIEIQVTSGSETRTIIFSGDIGRPNTPILRDPTRFEHADYVICESTYGNRMHGKTDDIPVALARIVNETCRVGGNIVIPSFAIERTQELVYRLSGLLAEKKIPRLTAYIDSPMAIKVTEVFRQHLDLFDSDAQKLIESGKHPCDFAGLTMSRSTDESKAIKEAKGTSIIIAGSGMCNGGRIKHHLKANIEREESTILFIGYQARGTLGRIILEGKKEKIRIHGQHFEVRARIEKINGFSAHADREELTDWLASIKKPRHLFVTHGEEEAATDFAEHIQKKTGWSVSVPSYLDEAELE